MRVTAGMTETAGPHAPYAPTRRAIVGALVWGLSPGWLYVVLSGLRPDLIASMLNHEFGLAFVVVTTGLTALSFVLHLVAVYRASRRVRLGLTIAASLLLTVPGLLTVLFAPIAFAFMYGNVVSD